MKQIVAWVNKWDKKQLEKYTNADIYFATSLVDFEKHINPDCIIMISATKHQTTKGRAPPTKR